MTIRVILPGALQEYAGGRHTLDVLSEHGMSVTALLDTMAADHPAVVRRIRDETGVLRHHVNVFINGDESRHLGGVEAMIPPGATVHIIPAVSGG